MIVHLRCDCVIGGRGETIGSLVGLCGEHRLDTELEMDLPKGVHVCTKSTEQSQGLLVTGFLSRSSGHQLKNRRAVFFIKKQCNEPFPRNVHEFC